MYKIAICDDEEVICSRIEKVIEEYFGKEILLSVFYSGEKVIESLDKGHTCDLMFLDIELEQMSGVELGTKIRKEYGFESMHIAFVSAKKNTIMMYSRSDLLISLTSL